MESGSKAVTSEFNEDALTMVENYEQNQTAGNFFEGNFQLNSNNDENHQLLQSPLDNINAPNAGESSMGLQAPPQGEELELPSSYQTQLEQLKANLLDDEQEELAPSAAGTGTNADGSFLHDHEHGIANPNQSNNLMQPAMLYSGSDNPNAHGDHGTNAQQEARGSPFSPLIMEPTHSFPLALAETLPPNGSSFGAQSSFYSEQAGANSAQANQLQGHVGSSRQAENLRPQGVEPFNPGKTWLPFNQFEQNTSGNSNFMNDNQQTLPQPSWFPPVSSGTGFLNGGSSSQINQQPTPNWASNTQNDLYRPLAPSGSQVNQFRASSSSGPQCYNFMLPAASSTPSRPPQLSNPRPLLTQAPNMPNAPDSMLQPSFMTTQPMPMQPMPQQHLSYPSNQNPATPGAYNYQNFGATPLSTPPPFAEFRTPILPPHLQTNPIGGSDLQYQNSVQPRSSTLPSGDFHFQDLSGQRHHQRNQANPTSNLFGQHSNSMMQDSLMHSGSHQLPPYQQGSGPFSMIPSLPNPESSLVPRPQTMEPQAMVHPTSRPIPTYPGSGNSSLILSSLFQPESGGSTSSAAGQMQTSEEAIFGRRGNNARIEVGEPSSPFKRFRRESSMPFQLNQATSSNSASVQPPRPMMNALYDPLFEGIGLPVDPHLRMFRNSNNK